MNISEIKPFEQNAKKHPKKQIDQIARSIKEFGFNQPIVIDKNNEIIVGHGRFFASQQLGLTDVPVIKLDNLTDEQVQAYRLADNKLNESEWDMSLVIENLKYLDSQNYDITLTGFDKDLIIESDEKDDQIPTNAPPVAKLGDLWALGRHKLYCGDSTEENTFTALMGDHKADMVFTDPPWNVAIGLNRSPNKQREGLINDDIDIDFFTILLKKSSEMIAKYNKGDTYCVMGSEQWPLIHRALTNAGLHWSSTIIWAKDVFVIGRAKYQRQYEPIWYGWKDKSTYKGDRKQSDLWHFDRPKVSIEHPTMKPVDLMVKAITNSSVQDDIVLDIFGGSGSTLIAAEKTNRICYMIEIDPKYCDVIIKRYEDYTGQKATKIS